MNIHINDLRRMIHEEYLRGVPEFVLRDATKKYVQEIRQHIFRFITTNKSQTKTDQRQAIAACNEVMDELEKNINDLLEDQLWNFIRRV